MKGPYVRLICWTYTFLLWFVVCNGKILLGSSQSQYLRHPAAYQFTHGQFRIKGDQFTVAVEPNGGVVTANEQYSGTGVTEETDVVNVDNGGVTVNVNGIYEGESTVQIQPAEPTVFGTDEQPNLINDQVGEDFLGQPQIIDDVPEEDLPPILQDLPPQIIITTQYCKLN